MVIEALDPHIGRRLLGRYRVVKILATGGQGTVYLARGEGAAGFMRPLVIKRILGHFESDPAKQEHFAREARITAQLRHPGIVPVLDFAQDGDSYVMVLEYVHGFDLRRWERYLRRTQGEFPADLAVYAVLKVLEALEYAHNLRGPDRRLLNVIHRDISPSNVLIDVGGHVRLTDFGIARMQTEQTTETDARHSIKGKLPYIAPEMFRDAQASVQTDVYACAVMLHELIAGTNEFRASNAATVAIRALEHIPSRLDHLRSDVSPALADVVASALAKDPSERPGSAAALADALRNALGCDLSELRARFCAAVRQDFEDPRMARTLGVPDLATLDRAWREWHTDDFTGQVDELMPAEDPTSVDAPKPSLPPPPVRKATRWGRWGLAAAAACTLAAVAWRGPDALAARVPQYVYTPPDTRVATAQPPGQRAAQRPAAPEAAGVDSATGEQTRAASLTKAFAAKQVEVGRCFREHGGTVEQLWVHFSVDSQGKVHRARVSPREHAQRPVAKCIQAVAQRVRFGAQPEPIAFRIPIRVSRVGPRSADAR